MILCLGIKNSEMCDVIICLATTIVYFVQNQINHETIIKSISSTKSAILTPKDPMSPKQSFISFLLFV